MPFILPARLLLALTAKSIVSPQPRFTLAAAIHWLSRQFSHHTATPA